VYNLKITELTPQRDMPSLVKILLKVPGLKPDDVSRGLKVPPLNVYSTEIEADALKLKNLLEKFGAACAIENTKAIAKEKVKKKDEEPANPTEAYLKNRHHHHRKFRYKFWLIIFSFIGVFAFITSYDFTCEIKQKQPNDKKVAPKARTSSAVPSNVVVNAEAAKANQELKKDIEKNPYNAEAWKALAKNLEKQGDTASARKARESYEKSVKAQQVLTSLAKAFGNKVRVEVTENEVYYRTGYDFTDEEFNAEAEQLMDSLSVKFPGKNLIIENYTSDNRIQNIQIKSPTKPK
jgi:hypothetical protein